MAAASNDTTALQIGADDANDTPMCDHLNEAEPHCCNKSDVMAPAQTNVDDAIDTAAIVCHTVITGNARSLRQAAGEVRKHVNDRRPDLFGLTETHLKGDAIKQLFPPGYKAVARLDRSKHGGGLVI